MDSRIQSIVLLVAVGLVAYYLLPHGADEVEAGNLRQRYSVVREYVADGGELPAFLEDVDGMESDLWEYQHGRSMYRIHASYEEDELCLVAIGRAYTCTALSPWRQDTRRGGKRS